MISLTTKPQSFILLNFMLPYKFSKFSKASEKSPSFPIQELHSYLPANSNIRSLHSTEISSIKTQPRGDRFLWISWISLNLPEDSWKYSSLFQNYSDTRESCSLFRAKNNLNKSQGCGNNHNATLLVEFIIKSSWTVRILQNNMKYREITERSNLFLYTFSGRN